MLTKLIS